MRKTSPSEPRPSRRRNAAVLACCVVASFGTTSLLRGQPVRARDEMGVRRSQSTCQRLDELAMGQTTAEESFSQLEEAVVDLRDGGFAAVWLEGVYPNRRVMMQWLGPDGDLLFGPGGKALTATTSEHDDAVIVADQVAGAYVAFTSGTEIVVQRFDAFGNPVWAGEGVRAIDPVDNFFFSINPFLVANPAGGVFVCEHVASNVYDIRCQSLDSSGARLWSSKGVSAAGGGGLDLRVLPRAVKDEQGGFLVFWRNQRNPFTGSASDHELMEGQHFSADGTALWGAAPTIVRTTNLPPDNGYSFRFFQVVPDGGGGAVLAFNDVLPDSGSDLVVMAQRVSGSGILLWDTGVLVASGTDGRQHDQTIATRDGGAFILAESFVSSTQDRLLLFRLNADGSQAWSPEGILVSDPFSSGFDYNSYGFYDGQNLHLAWTHQNTPGTFDTDVVLSTFQSDGAATSRIALTSASGLQFLNGLAFSDVSGEVLAVWDDWRHGPPPADTNTGATLLKLGNCPTGSFYTVTPCRLLDTRTSGAALRSSLESDVLAVGSCAIPSSASDVVLNVTAVGAADTGYLALFPAGYFLPETSTLNFRRGQTRANNSIIHLSFDGRFAIYPFLLDGSGQHVVIDVSGYFE